MWFDNEIFKNINYWFVFETVEDPNLYDHILIDYGKNHLELKFKFKRQKCFCYFESFKDSAETYIKDLEFNKIYQALNTYIKDKELCEEDRYVSI